MSSLAVPSPNPTNPVKPTLRSLIPILPVQSIARAVAFYRTLGVSAELYTYPEEYAFLSRDGLEMQLRRAPDLTEGEDPCGIYALLRPGTAAGLQAEFLHAGVPILAPLAPREWRMSEFVLSDPDGNLLRFGEPAERHDRA